MMVRQQIESLRECCENMDLQDLINSVQPVITKIRHKNEFDIDKIRIILKEQFDEYINIEKNRLGYN